MIIPSLPDKTVDIKTVYPEENISDAEHLLFLHFIYYTSKIKSP